MRDTIKQIYMTGPKTSEIREISMPKIEGHQVLIRNKYVGVCMSEHYDWSVAEAGQAFGHEPMGIIEKVGKDVDGFAVGDRVSGLWGGAMPGSGGMVEYAVADPAHNTIVKLPENVRDVDLILEPLSCILSAVSKARLTLPGTRVLVVGCGYMGCGAISVLKLRGAYVVAVDIRQSSLGNAKKYGADEVYLVDEAERLLAEGTLSCFELVMEWGETGESLDLAARMTRTCGQLCIGAYHTGGRRTVDVQLLNVRAIDCLSVHPREGALNSLCARRAAELLGSGVWNYKDLPVKVFPMSKFDQAQGEAESKYGQYMKAVIDMTLLDGEPYML